MDFSSLTIQLNFLPFGRKMFAFAVWKYCTFQRKRVAIRWALHLLNTSVPAYPLRLISWNGPSRSQGSLFPPAFPEDPQAAPYSTAALTLSAALPWPRDCLGTTPAHLAQGSLCPCGRLLSLHATSFSDGVGPHFTPMKPLCEMALGKDVIYLLAFPAFGWFPSVFLQHDMPGLWTS